jgi:hypothetical protein
MRSLLFALPLALLPVPAVAAPADPLPAQPRIPQELSDPAMADKLGKMMGGLTRALMDLPIGELQASVEGREPTEADRTRRVRDQIGGPDAARQVEAQVAASGRQVQAMSKALFASLPALMGVLGQMEKDLERATANLPDPTYPRR